jgi:DNA replication regulator SLD3
LKLTPRLIIPRACLPLAYLDLETDKDGRGGPRRFSAGGQALQTLGNLTHNAQEPKILIAEGHDDHRQYAVEALEQGEYVLCRLGKDVTAKDFELPNAKVRKISHGQQATTTGQDEAWWRSATVNHQDAALRKGMKDRSRIQGIRLSMKPPASAPLQEKSNQAETATPATPIKDEPTVEAEPIASIETVDTATSALPVDVFGVLRAQYLEALYTNKTSLAYFTKGPLTRARTAVQRTQQPEKLVELIEFLRSTILPLSASEKKYNEALPRIIEEIPVGITPEDADSLLASQIRKAKKRKKVSKEGLYPGEEEYVAKWWLTRETENVQGGPDDIRAQRIRRALVEQRAREIHIQIILILEVSALEATKIPVTVTSEDAGTATATDADKSQTQNKRPRKPLNLSTLLDILIDRLCIWHSTSQDEAKGAGIAGSGDTLTSHASNYDRLRDFCTEVIVP